MSADQNATRKHMETMSGGASLDEITQRMLPKLHRS